MSTKDFQNGFILGLASQANINNCGEIAEGTVTFSDVSYKNAKVKLPEGFVPSIFIMFPSYDADVSDNAIQGCIMAENPAFEKLEASGEETSFASTLLQLLFVTADGENGGDWVQLKENYDTLGSRNFGGGAISSGEIILPVTQGVSYLPDKEYCYIAIK